MLFADIRENKHDLPFKSSVFHRKKKAESEGEFPFSLEEEGKNRRIEMEDKGVCSFVLCFPSLFLLLMMKNKPKGLKVAKEVQMIGSMVNRLDGQ